MTFRVLSALLALLLMLSCGRADSKIIVEPELQPYFERFSQLLGRDASGVSASLTSLPSGKVGYCDIKENSKTILIDPTFWNKIGDMGKEQLVFHELGHCIFRRNHTSDLDVDGCPISIMHPNAFGDSWCYGVKHDYYLNELRGT